MTLGVAYYANTYNIIKSLKFIKIGLSKLLTQNVRCNIQTKNKKFESFQYTKIYNMKNFKNFYSLKFLKISPIKIPKSGF